ncbi:MAG: hypothetical protein PF961_23540 [Planctomycetota bacterium]|nr:hypothetical protein [Planctomycetota bacterium]
MAAGSLRHGYLFLTLTYVRGYEDLIFDMIDDAPHLEQVVATVERFAAEQVQRYLDAGVEWLAFPEGPRDAEGPDDWSGPISPLDRAGVPAPDGNAAAGGGRGVCSRRR